MDLLVKRHCFPIWLDRSVISDDRQLRLFEYVDYLVKSWAYVHHSNYRLSSPTRGSFRQWKQFDSLPASFYSVFLVSLSHDAPRTRDK